MTLNVNQIKTHLDKLRSAGPILNRGYVNRELIKLTAVARAAIPAAGFLEHALLAVRHGNGSGYYIDRAMLEELKPLIGALSELVEGEKP